MRKISASTIFTVMTAMGGYFMLSSDAPGPLTKAFDYAVLAVGVGGLAAVEWRKRRRATPPQGSAPGRDADR
jgi:hypothetical protein